MDGLWTGVRLTKELGVSKATLSLLTDCGVLEPQPLGTALLYDARGVQRLRDAKKHLVSTNAPDAWVVRLARPRMDDDRPIGWDERREDPVVNENAVRMYWRIKNPVQAEDGALVAVVGPLVVGVWRIIKGIRHEEIGRSEFELAPPTDEQLAAYWGNGETHGRWIELPSGPSVVRWPPRWS